MEALWRRAFWCCCSSLFSAPQWNPIPHPALAISLLCSHSPSLSLSLCLLFGVDWLINAQIGPRHGYGVWRDCVRVSGSMCLCLSVWNHPRRRQFKLIMQQSGPMTLTIIMVTTSIIHLQQVDALLDRNIVWSVVEDREEMMEWGMKTFTKEGNVVVFMLSAGHIRSYIVYNNFKCFHLADTDTHHLHRMNCNNSSDPLTLHLAPSSGQNVTFSNTLV